MEDLSIYSVRYWLGPVRLEDNKYYKHFTSVLEQYSDLMPVYEIINDLDDIWLYCVWPINDSVKRIIDGATYNIFSHALYREFET